ncbi:hypothetical protein Prudu_000957, partial [Prunus dulcis]
TFTNVVDGLTAETVIDSPLLTQKINSNRTIKVDINGKGDFKSVQAAIDSVPEGNSKWIIIHVRKGVYREKVIVPRSKPYIFMRGNGKGRSAIVWSQSSSDNVESATFSVEAPHFIAFGISFKNEAPTGVAYTSQNQSGSICGSRQIPITPSSIIRAGIIMITATSKAQSTSSLDVVNLSTTAVRFVIGDKRVSIKGSVTAQNRESRRRTVGLCSTRASCMVLGTLCILAGPRVPFPELFMHTCISPKPSCLKAGPIGAMLVAQKPYTMRNINAKGQEPRLEGELNGPNNSLKKKLPPSCLSTSSMARNGSQCGYELINP